MQYKVRGTIGDHVVDLIVDPLSTEPTPAPEPEPLPDPELPYIEAWRGETVYAEAQVNSPFPTTFYKARMVSTANASWRGARIGAYPDCLEPVAEGEEYNLCAIHVPRDAAPGSYNIGDILLKVEDRTLPDKPLFPMYCGLQSQHCFDAFRKATGSTDWSKQGEVAQWYIDMLRSFWIEPYKHTTTFFPTNLEKDVWGGTKYSYYEVAINQAIATPMLWAGERSAPNGAWLFEVANSKAKVWFHGIDEPGTGPSGITAQEAFDRVNLLQGYGSVVQTGAWYNEYANMNVEYCKPINWIDTKPGAPDGLYTSCMAAGNCSNNSDPNARTDYPTLAIEGDPYSDWQRFITLSREKAEFALYFHSTLNLTKCWDSGGLYQEGVNGGGTLFYYNPTTGEPWPSVRLAHLHIALQEMSKV